MSTYRIEVLPIAGNAKRAESLQFSSFAAALRHIARNPAWNRAGGKGERIDITIIRE